MRDVQPIIEDAKEVSRKGSSIAFRSVGSQKYFTAQIKRRLGYLTFQSQADYRDYLFSFESRPPRPWK